MYIFASENVKILLNRVKSKNTNVDMQDWPSQVSVLVCALNKAHNYVSKFTSVITQNSEQLQAGMLPAASSTATHTHTHTHTGCAYYVFLQREFLAFSLSFLVSHYIKPDNFSSSTPSSFIFPSSRTYTPFLFLMVWLLFICLQGVNGSTTP